MREFLIAFPKKNPIADWFKTSGEEDLKLAIAMLRLNFKAI